MSQEKGPNGMPETTNNGSEACQSTKAHTWPGLADQVLNLEAEGLVSRTFRRLDPDRQTAVLQAIVDEAALRGLSELNIKNVAQRAGVAVGSLYQYFGNRERLVETTVRLCRRYVEDILRESIPYLLDMTLEEAIFTYIYFGYDWMKQESSLMTLFASAAYKGDEKLNNVLIEPIATSMRDVIRQLLTAADKRGELRAGVDIERMASFVHANSIIVGDSAILPYLNKYFLVHDGDLESTLRDWVSMMLSGIRK